MANRNLCCAGVAFGIYSYRISRTSVTVEDVNWKQNRAGKTETMGYEAKRQDPKTWKKNPSLYAGYQPRELPVVIETYRRVRPSSLPHSFSSSNPSPFPNFSIALIKS